MTMRFMPKATLRMTEDSRDSHLSDYQSLTTTAHPASLCTFMPQAEKSSSAIFATTVPLIPSAMLVRTPGVVGL